MALGMLVVLGAMCFGASFLAGLFGMAGGVLLMAGLLAIMPVADAMVLHGATQSVANAWRAVLWWRYVMWRVLARYLAGLLVASALLFGIVTMPDARVIYLMLGIVPFLGVMLPRRMVPQADQRWGAELCGFVCTVLQLLSGVAGPLFDVFFVRTELDRRVIVATKSACMVVTHVTKTLYFGVLVAAETGLAGDPVVMIVALVTAVAGTTAARPLLERLSDQTFRRVTTWLVMAVGATYLLRGIAGFL